MANIDRYLSNIKSALFGKEVRDSIYNGIDEINNEVKGINVKQTDLESTFDSLVINAGNSNAEIVDARVKSDGYSYKKIGDRLNDIDANLNNINNTLKSGKTDGIAFNVKTDFMGSLENHIKKIKEIGATGQMVVFASVSGVNDTNIEANPKNIMDTAFTYVDNSKLDISLMKVHLVCNFKDGTESYRTSIAPANGNEKAFFDNYKEVLKFYLDYCIEHNVGNFCIANENTTLVRERRFLTYWAELISELKRLYPTIKFSYSMNSKDIKYFQILKENDVDNVLNYLDFLSFNIYPKISNNASFNENEAYENHIKTLYSTNVINDLKKYHRLYDKDIMITETGCTHTISSLNKPEENLKENNTKVQGVYYKVILDTIASIDFIKGSYIWNVSEPFSFYNTDGEIILKDHFGGEK